MLFFGKFSNNLNKYKMSNYEIIKEKINNVIPYTKDWAIENVIKKVKGENAGDSYTIGYDCWLKANGALIELTDGYDYYLTDFVLIGKELSLNDVLIWHSSNGVDKYSHFEVSKGEAYFSIYEGEEKESIVWDLSKQYLRHQSPKLLEWLSTLG